MGVDEISAADGAKIILDGVEEVKTLVRRLTEADSWYKRLEYQREIEEKLDKMKKNTKIILTL